jgi:hypothetical protein
MGMDGSHVYSDDAGGQFACILSVQYTLGLLGMRDSNLRRNSANGMTGNKQFERQSTCKRVSRRSVQKDLVLELLAC